MDIEALGLKAGETVRDLEELCPHGLQVAEALFESEVSEIVRAYFIAQERGELLVLLDQGVLPVRPEDVNDRVRSVPGPG